MRVGIFDSGVGGLLALEYFREMIRGVDTVFYADSENAPYGTKSEDELVTLAEADIERLISLGAERVLMACCTASAVYGKLQRKYREISIPIIAPTAARACELSETGRIGVISTEATRRSGAFSAALTELCPGCEIISASAGELVTLAECGICDRNLGRSGEKILRNALLPFFEADIDTLILGCTHFGKFKGSIEKMLGVRAVDSAMEGARALCEFCKANMKQNM